MGVVFGWWAVMVLWSRHRCRCSPESVSQPGHSAGLIAAPSGGAVGSAVQTDLTNTFGCVAEPIGSRNGIYFGYL